MKTLLWIALGWLGVTFWTGLGAHLVVGHILPDCAVITVVFLAFRREPIPLLLAALALGYLVGRQALAPVGLHETALALCALGVHLAAGHLAASGALAFALASATTAMLHHLLVFLLMVWVEGTAGFSSWGTATLLPAAAATGLLAWGAHPLMAWLERRLSQQKREGLSWR